MGSESYVFVDIETSGASSRFSRVIEFAAIRVENGIEVGRYQTLIDPGVSLPAFITSLTGISDEDLARAPSFYDCHREILEIMNGAVFVAHNARFDYSFLKAEFKLLGIKFNPKMLCTVRLSRALYPSVRGHSLKAIISRHGIKTTDRHRAMADTQAMLDFYNLANREHSEIFEQTVSRLCGIKAAPPNVPESQFKNIPECPGVYIFYDSEDKPLYVGKSINLKNRVASHFQDLTPQSKGMKMAMTTHRIETIKTSNELSALLLESKLVKDLLPLYNRMLRRARKLYALKKLTSSEGYHIIQIVTLDEHELQPGAELAGIYKTKRQAMQSLEKAQATYELCPKLLSIEKSNRACFLHQIKKCRGACIGIENPAIYNARLMLAFQRSGFEDWPYQSPIVLSDLESSEHGLVLNNWNIVGEISADDGCEPLYREASLPFDLDTYKILRGYIKNKAFRTKIQPISLSDLESLRV